MKSKTQTFIVTLTTLSLLTLLLKATADSKSVSEQDSYLQKLRNEKIGVYLDKLN